MCHQSDLTAHRPSDDDDDGDDDGLDDIHCLARHLPTTSFQPTWVSTVYHTHDGIYRTIPEILLR